MHHLPMLSSLPVVVAAVLMCRGALAGAHMDREAEVMVPDREAEAPVPHMVALRSIVAAEQARMPLVAIPVASYMGVAGHPVPVEPIPVPVVVVAITEVEAAVETITTVVLAVADQDITILPIYLA